MTAPDGNAVAAALSMALAAGTREAFEELLTEDVHWGGEHGGNECRTRIEAGDHYAGLLAAGVSLRIAGIRELDPLPTVELLYFESCPHYDTFLPHLRQLLGHHYPTAPISEINITTEEEAQQHRFLGSPTLRVNGRDVEPGAEARDTYGLQCRIYATSEGIAGAPTDQWITDALVDAPAGNEAVDALLNAGADIDATGGVIGGGSPLADRSELVDDHAPSERAGDEDTAVRGKIPE